VNQGPEPIKRPRCDGCDRPRRTCLCSHLLPVAHQTRLLILRHPSETSHPLNTAEIVARMSKRCRLLDGEVFAQADCLLPGYQSLLLFPGDDAAALQAPADAKPVQLILLDGTWRKARALLRMNPWLAALPQVSMCIGPSRYLLRKQKAEGASTLEACVAALGILEPPGETFAPMLATLDRLMQLQREAMGETRFQQDFGDRLSPLEDSTLDQTP